MGEWLLEAGAELDVRRPYRGDVLPEQLSEHRSMVVLGGSMGAADDVQHPWLSEVRFLVRSAVVSHTPVLGICLGHQLVAAALGARVRRNPLGQQMGVLDMGWLPPAGDDALFGRLFRVARRAVQWNNDVVVDLPERVVVLARTAQGEVQAARFAPTVWGVQCHPEAGVEIVRTWAENDRADAVGRGGDVDLHLAEIAEARAELRDSWRGLATGFAELTRPVTGNAVAAVPLAAEPGSAW